VIVCSLYGRTEGRTVRARACLASPVAKLQRDRYEATPQSGYQSAFCQSPIYRLLVTILQAVGPVPREDRFPAILYLLLFCWRHCCDTGPQTVLICVPSYRTNYSILHV
jgi:hypothetical protein